MADRYEQVIPPLREAYNGGAAERDQRARAPWKVAERARFLARLLAEGKRQLLEVGAGTGQDGLFFQEQGLDVTCTDLSPEMVRRCRAKGLRAYEMDFLHLDFFAQAFDGVYAINCLLHVPSADLPQVLDAIRTVLRPDGLFFLGVYGGVNREGPAPDDCHVPPRFFAFRTDEQLQGFVRDGFDIVSFERVRFDADDPIHFQSLTLRRRERAG